MRSNIEEKYKTIKELVDFNLNLNHKLEEKLFNSLNDEFQECADKINKILKEYDMGICCNTPGQSVYLFGRVKYDTLKSRHFNYDFSKD